MLFYGKDIPCSSFKKNILRLRKINYSLLGHLSIIADTYAHPQETNNKMVRNGRMNYQALVCSTRKFLLNILLNQQWHKDNFGAAPENKILRIHFMENHFFLFVLNRQ